MITTNPCTGDYACKAERHIHGCFSENQPAVPVSLTARIWTWMFIVYALVVIPLLGVVAFQVVQNW